MKMVAYGVSGDLKDVHLGMYESTTQESMYRFCMAVAGKSGPHYLRGPNEEETTHIMTKNKARGFHGMLGSIDCMHWSCKNYPIAWQGFYKWATWILHCDTLRYIAQ
jgi:hypothetical protein